MKFKVKIENKEVNLAKAELDHETYIKGEPHAIFVTSGYTILFSMQEEIVDYTLVTTLKDIVRICHNFNDYENPNTSVQVDKEVKNNIFNVCNRKYYKTEC